DMAPTTLRVALSGIKDGDYPGVTYSREWIYDKENLVITKDEGDTKEFTIENPGKIPLEIIEVRSGVYLEEDDVIRVSSSGVGY
ncbi:hypothetical protein L3C96_24560, partial [Escherichia coli]|nr:hypothetical protein [Escherichia coli]